MKIVAIITSVNYHDYLVYSILSITRSTDAVYVVTNSGDASILVALKYGATPVIYKDWCLQGATFNKAGAIHKMQHIVYDRHPDAWYLMLDADIVLQKETRQIIENYAINESALYGSERLDFHTLKDFLSGKPNKTYQTSQHKHYKPGYFQLYKQHIFYPKWSRSAEACDLRFAMQFENTRTLPLTVAHCGYEGINWNGRVSPQWPILL